MKMTKRAKGASLVLNSDSMIDVYPSTDNQKVAFQAWSDGDDLVLAGSAGTGKTFMALSFALRNVLQADHYGDKKHHKVVIFRSAVATRPIGFLPGNLKEKIEEFAGPYKGLCAELLDDPDAFHKLSTSGVLQFETTSYVRGLTINDAIIIVDEMQNLNFHELDSVITRVGKNCRIIFCGDYNQSDFKAGDERDGLLSFLNIIEHMNNFSIVTFTWEDIVRSGLVRDYIMTKEMLQARRS